MFVKNLHKKRNAAKEKKLEKKLLQTLTTVYCEIMSPSLVSLLTTRNTYVYKNIRLYFYFWRWYLCGAEKQLQRVRAHEGAVGRRKSQWTTDFSRNSGTYIVYNFHMTCSNSSFSLTMVTPTSHFFAFHWLCSLLPIGYFPKPGSVGVRICKYHRIQPHP